MSTSPYPPVLGSAHIDELAYGANLLAVAFAQAARAHDDGHIAFLALKLRHICDNLADRRDEEYAAEVENLDYAEYAKEGGAL